MATLNVTALILAGGLGTRLHTVLPDRPKVLAPVAGRPFLSYLLDQLQTAGIRRTVLCTGHRGNQLETAFGPRYAGMDLTYSREETPLGTGGALRLALPHVEGNLALVLNGDSYVDGSLPEFYAWHGAHSFPGSLLLTSVADTERFGTVDFDPDGRILAFREKEGLVQPGWINAGIYLLSRCLLESLAAGQPVSLEREAFPAWLAGGLGGFPCRSAFLDIGTPESLAQAEAFFTRLPKRRVALLDRDGTIIAERHYLASPEDVELLPGALEGLRRLTELKIGLAIVSNQSGLGRGYFDRPALDAVNQRLQQLLAQNGIPLAGIYVCPHTEEDGCDCRKPKPGLALQAAADLGFAPTNAFVIGDKACDIDLGATIGARTFLVRTGYGSQMPSDVQSRAGYVVADLLAAAEIIGSIIRGS
jgi:histidinol-phosphate phosphatase family protein